MTLIAQREEAKLHSVITYVGVIGLLQQQRRAGGEAFNYRSDLGSDH